MRPAPQHAVAAGLLVMLAVTGLIVPLAANYQPAFIQPNIAVRS